MILSCQNIWKSFGEDTILRSASFHIEEHEKAAIVGINGAGKTTLLRILTGESRPDEGAVTISKGTSMGYLRQHQDISGEATIYTEIMSVKQELLDMEKRLREMETAMKDAPSGEYDGLIGIYEGGGYTAKGIYRPREDCRMRTNVSGDFCPVCRRAINRMIDYYTK